MKPNVYLDHNGQEQPIVYKAADLVNCPAPEGYHWELDLRAYRDTQQQMHNQIEQYQKGKDAIAGQVTSGEIQPDYAVQLSNFYHHTIDEYENKLLALPLPTDGYICVLDTGITFGA